MLNMLGQPRESVQLEMKSTKVQNSRRILHILRLVYANARARKLATPRFVAVTRDAVSSRSNTG